MPAWEATGLIAAHAARRRRLGGVAADGPRPGAGRARGAAGAGGARGPPAHGHDRSARPAWASRGCCASSSAARPPATRTPGCARGAACPMARASSTGRSARSCAARRTSWTPTAPRRRGPSCARYVRDALGDAEEKPERRAGADRALAGLRRAAGARARRRGRPRAHARRLLLRAAHRDRGFGGPAAR